MCIRDRIVVGYVIMAKNFLFVFNSNHWDIDDVTVSRSRHFWPLPVVIEPCWPVGSTTSIVFLLVFCSNHVLKVQFLPHDRQTFGIILLRSTCSSHLNNPITNNKYCTKLSMIATNLQQKFTDDVGSRVYSIGNCLTVGNHLHSSGCSF